MKMRGAKVVERTGGQKIVREGNNKRRGRGSEGEKRRAAQHSCCYIAGKII